MSKENPKRASNSRRGRPPTKRSKGHFGRESDRSRSTSARTSDAARQLQADRAKASAKLEYAAPESRARDRKGNVKKGVSFVEKKITERCAVCRRRGTTVYFGQCIHRSCIKCARNFWRLEALYDGGSEPTCFPCHSCHRDVVTISVGTELSPPVNVFVKELGIPSFVKQFAARE
ncbi:hypothetical protein RUND412_007441 [Rhizina undulata]